MNGKIDHMVSKNISAVYKIVEGKCKAGQRAVLFLLAVTCNTRGFFNVFPGYRYKMSIWIIHNIGHIIKMPLAMEAVSINDNKRNKEGDEGKGIFFAFTEMPLQVKVK